MESAFLLPMPTYDAYCPTCEEENEIIKPMSAPMPRCSVCGTQMTRLYRPIAVTYNAPGFFATDYARFEREIGQERAARFYKQRDEILIRAKSGRLTPYETALEKA